MTRAIAAVHACRKQVAGLDDDAAWRGFLDATVGKRSLRKMSERELGRVIDELHRRGAPKKPSAPKRAGSRPLAGGEVQRKIRALWISLYHLGLVKEPAESALAAFVKRQVGVDDLRWLDPGEAYRVVEALKAWAARPIDQGGAAVDWSPYVKLDEALQPQKYENPRGRVMEAQWHILHVLGVIKIGDINALAAWAELVAGVPHRVSHVHLLPAQADRVIERLGAKIRASKPREKADA